MNPLGDFTEKDYELLMDALDAWERSPMDEGMQTAIFSTLLRPPGSDKAGAEEKMKASMSTAEGKTRARKSIAILLRAKLELARQAAQAASIAAPDPAP